MKMKLGLGILAMLAFPAITLAGGDSTATKYAGTIKAAELKAHLEVLASDAYEGRETGQPGQKKAAQYIAEHFQSLEMPGLIAEGYFQPVELQSLHSDGVSVSTDIKTYNFLKDFYFYPGFDDQVITADKMTFLGYGIQSENYNDYKDVDVKGKVLLVLDKEPRDKKGQYLVSGSGEVSKWSWDWRKKITAAKDNGAKALMVIVDDMDTKLDRIKGFLGKPSLQLVTDVKSNGLPVLYISKSMAYELMSASGEDLEKVEKKIIKKKTPIQFEWSEKVTLNLERAAKPVSTENVLGYVEGTDLKDEIIVITAHYDHLGKKGDDIYNGADDDGSGTVALLELAQAYAMAKKNGNGPRRSVLFMTVTGEEKGLLGSQYYVEHPIFPLENTVANFNIDMIGREDTAHYNNNNYVYLIGSDKLSTELHNISESTNTQKVGLELDYTYNDPEDPNRFYYRSDHYNFAKHNIPVIFYFCGTHNDYHKPSDTVEKINFEKMEKITRLIFYTSWEVANRDQRLIVDKAEEKEEKKQ